MVAQENCWDLSMWMPETSSYGAYLKPYFRPLTQTEAPKLDKVLEDRSKYRLPENSFARIGRSTVLDDNAQKHAVNVISINARIEVRFPWIKGIYDVSESNFSSESIYPLVDAIPRLFEEGRYGDVDDILASVNYRRLSPPFMVSLLRVTFPAKAKLCCWASSLDGVRNILDSQNLNSARYLRGLQGARVY